MDICFLCQRPVPKDKMEVHVNACLDQQQEEENSPPRTRHHTGRVQGSSSRGRTTPTADRQNLKSSELELIFAICQLKLIVYHLPIFLVKLVLFFHNSYIVFGFKKFATLCMSTSLDFSGSIHQLLITFVSKNGPFTLFTNKWVRVLLLHMIFIPLNCLLVNGLQVADHFYSKICLPLLPNCPKPI